MSELRDGGWEWEEGPRQARDRMALDKTRFGSVEGGTTGLRFAAGRVVPASVNSISDAAGHVGTETVADDEYALLWRPAHTLEDDVEDARVGLGEAYFLGDDPIQKITTDGRGPEARPLDAGQAIGDDEQAVIVAQSGDDFFCAIDQKSCFAPLARIGIAKGGRIDIES